ncbi:phosphomethylpyrimidine synthase ThiC [candidate division WOR-3 bacterium]|nr:phosphomethylpyrimidine synthase ThiC [candidate division WOR-3 bacterium]
MNDSRGAMNAESRVIERVASRERIGPALLRQLVEQGRVVLLGSRKHGIEPVAVGKGTRVKVNANIGSSPDVGDQTQELVKLRAAIAAGTDTVMDLSVGRDPDETRRAVVAESSVPVGTVPIYQVALDSRSQGRPFVEASRGEILAGVEKHLADGVDFITVHCGINRRNVSALERAGRLCGVVSRGGSMTVEWMRHNRQENPLYECYDEVLAVAREYGAALSLGDGLRPGALADATDGAQIAELLTIGELVMRARDAGVAAIVEGPGHVPLDQIEANVVLEKRVCDEAPFYLLGPLVTDVACGYDHISGAIGGALAAFYGADFLCYVTPTEHLALPGPEDVRAGVVASRIAAHAADVARRHPGALDWDRRVSEARAALNWDEMIRSSIDPARAREVFDAARSGTEGACTMCGDFCAIRRMKQGPETEDSSRENKTGAK